MKASRDPRGDVAIEAEGVSKAYARADDGKSRLRFMRGGGHNEEDSEPALTDVSLAVGWGESIGIVGRNGAGKSTLLKLLAGITEPDAGRGAVHGHLLPVIGPAAGMKPDLSGRENIEVRAATLGIGRAELHGRMDDIIEFSELGEYIDRPFRMYSAGMKARLGFAVSFAFEPDILLVARVSEIQANGATIVLVSHAPHMIVQFCDRALLLEAGRKLGEGKPKAVTDAYQKLLLADESERAATVEEIRASLVPDNGGNDNPEGAGAEQQARAPAAEDETAGRRGELVAFARPSTRWQSAWVGASLESVAVDDSGSAAGEADMRYASYRCTRRVKVAQPVRDLEATVLIRTAEGIGAATVHVARHVEAGQSDGRVVEKGTHELVGWFVNRLQPGHYTLEVTIHGAVGNNRLRLQHVKDALAFQCVGGADDPGGIVDLTIPETASEPSQETEAGPAAQTGG